MTPDFFEKIERDSLSPDVRAERFPDDDERLTKEALKVAVHTFLREVSTFRSLPLTEALDMLLIDWVCDESKTWKLVLQVRVVHREQLVGDRRSVSKAF